MFLCDRRVQAQMKLNREATLAYQSQPCYFSLSRSPPILFVCLCALPVLPSVLSLAQKKQKKAETCPRVLQVQQSSPETGRGSTLPPAREAPSFGLRGWRPKSEAEQDTLLRARLSTLGVREGDWPDLIQQHAERRAVRFERRVCTSKKLWFEARVAERS